MDFWWRAKESDRGGKVVAAIHSYAKDQAPRREQARKRLAAYNARSALDMALTSESYWQIGSHAPSEHGFARSVIDTGHSRLFCKQRPKPSMQTVGGSYVERVQARRYTKFMEGLMWAPQDPFANTWEVTEQAAHDCMALFDYGLVKVYADAGQKKVVHERCFAPDTFTDPTDARHGKPQSFYHMYPCDRTVLKDQLKAAGKLTKEKERAIDNASLHQEHAKETSKSSEHDLITVYEAWRRNTRHVIAVDSGNGNALVDEDWDRGFPFAPIRWGRNHVGWAGTPAIDEIRHIQDQANKYLAFILENANLGAGGFVFAPEGIEEEDIINNGAFRIFRQPGVQVHTPPMFNPQVREVFELLKSQCYELLGFSEMAAAGRKEMSITSGIAIQTMEDVQTQRHIRQARAYEQMFQTIGELDVLCVQDLVDSKVKLSTILPDEGFLDTIDWDELNLKTDMFEVRIQPSSSTEDSIAAKKQAVTELAQAGYISPDVAKAALMDSNTDLDSLNQYETAQKRYVERIAARFEMFDPEKDSWGEVFSPPDPLINLPKAIMQMTGCYINMLADDAPEANRELVRAWIAQADEKERQKQQKAAPPPGPPQGGAPPGPGMPAPAPMPQMGPQPIAAE